MAPDCRACRWSAQRPGPAWQPVLWCAWRERACVHPCDQFCYEPGALA